jgi:hypothetical protein
VQRLQCTQACMICCRLTVSCLLIACASIDMQTTQQHVMPDIINQSSVQHRTVQSANSSIVPFLAIQPNGLHKIQLQLSSAATWLHCAPCCKHCCMLSLCTHALSMPVCMQSSPVCHEVPVWHMLPMRSASEDSEPAYHCSHLWTGCKQAAGLC